MENCTSGWGSVGLGSRLRSCGETKSWLYIRIHCLKRSLTCQVWMFDDVCIVRSLEKRHVVCKLSHRLQESYMGFAHGAISMTVAVLSHQTLWNGNSTPSVSSGKNGSVVKWLPITNNQLPKPQKSCITIPNKVGIPTNFKDPIV